MNPKKEYNDQKHHSRERGIPFLLDYSEWLELWLLSGKYAERGKESGKYVMARYGDIGAYSIRNCYICTVEENSKVRHDRTQKVSNSQADEIRRLYLDTRLTQYQLAEMFNLDQSHISRIVNFKRRNK